MKFTHKIVLLTVAVLLLASHGTAQEGYRKPPKEVLDILDAPSTPLASVSPMGDRIALLEPVRYPPVADLAEPMLRLAGLRINPKTNSDHRERYYTNLTLMNIADGRKTVVKLPGDVRLINPKWSSDGRYIAAGNVTPGGVELWIIGTADGRARKIEKVRLNTAFGKFDWMPDRNSLLVNLVPDKRGPAPPMTTVPTSPSIQETSGRAAAIRTFQDLLTSPHDEKLFEHYTTSQLAVVGLDGRVTPVGKPSIFAESEPSPDGRFILVSRIVRPYSYLFPFWSFPNEVEVWDLRGETVYKIASVPMRDNLPVGGVTTAPRNWDWIPTEAATLLWVEALDGGDPRRDVKPRDRVMIHQVPTKAAPRELFKIEQRYAGRMFGERDGLLWFYDYDRDRQRRRTFVTDYRNAAKMKLVSDVNIRDRYNDIGDPVTQPLPNGKRVIVQNGASIYLEGSGATPQGDRPFLRRMDLETLETNELFRSGEDEYETFVALLDPGAERFVTRRETETEPPNLLLHRRDATGGATKPLTDFKDPTPQLRGIKKQLVKYKRSDGVDLSFTLYLPADHKEGERLPALLWAYPLEYTSDDVAGQVTGSTNRFTTIGGYSHLFLLTQGYAILDNATVPIVGDPLTVNDTFIEQLVAGARAAVEKAAEMGVIDPDRVGVGGHSYGAFMTAHLLANSDIFRAGIARSGAYNRTLTPFGFQSERRSFWEAPESYYTLSPFMRANLINEPILLIHGEADNNSGTYPMQSERMFAAIRGNGGTARLVMLPHESHGYAARESIEHVLWEQIRWMDRHVKNAPPRTKEDKKAP